MEVEDGMEGSVTLRRLEWTVLGIALVLRFLGIASLETTAWADVPLVDAYTYWDQTKQLLAGRDPFAQGYYQPPGYPHFLALVTRLGGGEPDLGWVRQVQALLGFGTTWGVLVLGRRLGRRLETPWLGAAAAGLFTLYPTLLLFEQDILTPALTGALFVGALVLVWLRKAPAPWRGGLAGLLMGICAAVHPTYLLAVPALVLVIGPRRHRRTVFALVLGLAIGLAPTTIRNWRDWDQVALVSHNAGLNLYLANNPDWKNTGFLKAGLPSRRLFLEAEPHKRDSFQRNEYWLDRTRQAVMEDPGAWFKGVATRALWSVNRLEIPRNEDYRCRTAKGSLAWLGWLPVRYGWLFPLALLGAVHSWRRGERGLAVLWASLHLQLLIFLVADRYRVSTWPLVALAGAGGLGVVVGWVRTQALKPRVLAWLLPAVLLPWMPIDERAGPQPSWCLHLEGHMAWMAGDFDRAAGLYEAALAEDQTALNSGYWLAQAHHKQGRHESAATALGPVLADFPTSYKALVLMSRIQEARGDLDQAARMAGRAYRVPGPRTNTGVRWIRLLVQAGDREAAELAAAADPLLADHPKVRTVLDR